MGASQSADDASVSPLGFHVLQVVPDSPADRAGIEVFFDYITHVNGMRLEGESTVLASQIRSNIGKPVRLIVHSSKTMMSRNVIVVPEKHDYGYLGCSVRLCYYHDAHTHLWHILSVSPNSPSETAGLQPGSDYIIGTPHTVLHEKDDFFDLVRKMVGKPVQVYVYNAEMDTIREVLIVPNTNWGGDGLLGCDVGYGYLHRIALYKLPEEVDVNMSLIDKHAHNHHDHDHHAHDHHDHDNDHHDHKHNHLPVRRITTNKQDSTPESFTSTPTLKSAPQPLDQQQDPATTPSSKAASPPRSAPVDSSKAAPNPSTSPVNQKLEVNQRLPV